MRLRDLLSTFRAIMGPFVFFPCIRGTFCELSVYPQDIPSSSVSSLCGHGTLCKLPSPFCAAEGPSVLFPCIRGLSGNLLYIRRTFRQVRQLSVRPRDLLSTFRMPAAHSVNFCQPSIYLPCVSVTFCQLKSTCHASTGDSVNLLYSSWTFRQLPSSFRASVGPSIILS